ncbi:MAG: hypothetical protein GX779_06650, partial [Clostridia bacterium]|nr:hypothetical protein [Clostridia bacterium]
SAAEEKGMKTGAIAILLGAFLVILVITMFLIFRSGPKGKLPIKGKEARSTKKMGKSARKGTR